MDKGHKERCPYLLPRPEKIKIIPAKDTRSLFGKFMSCMLYHWHRLYGIGYAECILVPRETYLEFRITFEKDVSRLGDSYRANHLNFAAVELSNDILKEQNLSLLSGERSIGKIVDLSGFETGIYPLAAARDNYYYFSDKMNLMTIGKQIYGIGLVDKTILGVYVDGKKVVYIN
jgi:hypothetical protein